MGGISMTKFTNFIAKLISIVLGIFVLINVYGMVINSYIARRLVKDTTHQSYFFTYALILIGALVLVLGIVVLFKLISKANNKTLNILAIIFMGIYCAISVGTIIIFPTIPNSDSYQVIDQALMMATGKTNIIDGNSLYFGMYGNNNAIVIILYYLFSIFKFVGVNNLIIVSRIFNVICIVGANLLFYFAILKLTNKKAVAVKFLLLSTLLPSVPFVSSWVYTPTLCLPFMGGILLCGANLINSKSKKSIIINSAIIGVLTIVGYNVRPVVVILSIAGLICMVLWSLQDKKRFFKTLISLLVCAVVSAGTFLCTSAIDNHYYTGSEKAFPLSHWVAMSLVGNGNYYPPMVIRHQKMNSTEEINADSIHIIEDTLKNEPAGELLKHQFKKTCFMWADGTLGYKSRQVNCQKYNEIQKYVSGNKCYFMMMYCQMMWLALHIFILICLFNMFRNKCSKKNLIFAITILGAYLFYIAWEIKSNYAIPFVPFIIAFATMGGIQLESKLTFTREKVKTGYKVAVAGISIVFVALWLCITPLVTACPIDKKDFKIQNLDTKSVNIKKVSKLHRSIKQEFYLNSDFNRVSIHVGHNKKAKKASYLIRLKDQNNKVICKRKLNNKKDVKGGKIVLCLPKTYYPKGNEKFTIEIQGTGKGADRYKFKKSSSELIDCVPGNIYIDGKLDKGDLKFAVVKTYNSSLLSKSTYFTLIAFIAIIEVLIYIGICKNKKVKVLSKQ